MNLFAMVQRKIVKNDSYNESTGITTVRVRPDMYFNFSHYVSNEADQTKPKTMHDFNDALRFAFEAFDKALESKMGSEQQNREIGT